MTQLSFALVLLLLTASVGAPEGPQKSKGHAKNDHRSAATVPDERASVSIQLVFSSRDAVAIREYYAPRYRRLPPGQQKKLARGGSLPPGWERKMEFFPPVLEQRLARLPEGYHRGVIDAHAVIYKAGSPIVIDAAVLF
jgi:hypothetical protein